MLSRRLVTGGMASAMFAGPFASANAQPANAWPDKPVKLIVNFAPGGSTDNAARPFAERLSRVFGQQFVIENKGGASGALGMEAAVRSDPDGYTFLITPALSVTILPHMRKLPFDVFKDLKPVARFTDATLLVAVHPSVPANSIPELVDYAKKNPGKLNWGTAGFGSQGHMLCESLKAAAGIDILHVPYKGGGESLADFLAGVHQIHADANTFPHIAQGKGKLLAVVDLQRHPDYPNVPLLKDFYPEIDYYGWFGVYAPAGTPDAIIAKLGAALNRIAAEPDLVAQFRKLALRPNASSPEELAKTMRSDSERYGAVVRRLNLRVE